MKKIVAIILTILLSVSVGFNIYLGTRLQRTEDVSQISQDSAEQGPIKNDGTEVADERNVLFETNPDSIMDRCRNATSICIYKDYNISGTPMALEALYQIYHSIGENRAHFLYRPQDKQGRMMSGATSSDFSLEVFNEILDLICSTELTEYTYAVDQNGQVIDYVVPYAVILGDSQGYFLLNPIVLKGPDNLDEVMKRFEKLVSDAGGIVYSDSGYKALVNIAKPDGSNAVFSLKAGADGAQHYASVSSITLHLDNSNEDYIRLGNENKIQSESAALFAITGNVLASHTQEEIHSSLDSIKDELVERYQGYYAGSEFITGVEFNDLTIQ